MGVRGIVRRVRRGVDKSACDSALSGEDWYAGPTGLSIGAGRDRRGDEYWNRRRCAVTGGPAFSDPGTAPAPASS